jgi:hypothetical protein
MSLADVYQRALNEKYEYPKGWMANWPPGFDQVLGAVGPIAAGKINRNAVLSDKGIKATSDPDPGQPDGPWTFQSDKNISVAIGVDAKAPGWGWIRNAKAGVKIGFGENEGVVLGIGSSHQERLLNIDGLKEPLLQAAEEGKIAVGEAVIVEKQVADKGLQITSHGQNASFTATTGADVGPAGAPSLASFAVDLNVHEESHEAANESYPNGFTIAFRVLKLGTRGWFWWKHIVVEGIVEVTDEDQETLLDDDDYFVLLTSARTS